MTKKFLEAYYCRDAERYYPYLSDKQKLSKLAEEVTELNLAVAKHDPENIREEIGDCLYVMLHILHQKGFPDVGVNDLLKEAHDKLIERVNKPAEWFVCGSEDSRIIFRKDGGTNDGRFLSNNAVKVIKDFVVIRSVQYEVQDGPIAISPERVNSEASFREIEHSLRFIAKHKGFVPGQTFVNIKDRVKYKLMDCPLSYDAENDQLFSMQDGFMIILFQGGHWANFEKSQLPWLP